MLENRHLWGDEGSEGCEREFGFEAEGARECSTDRLQESSLSLGLASVGGWRRRFSVIPHVDPSSQPPGLAKISCVDLQPSFPLSIKSGALLSTLHAFSIKSWHGLLTGLYGIIRNCRYSSMFPKNSPLPDLISQIMLAICPESVGISIGKYALHLHANSTP